MNTYHTYIHITYQIKLQYICAFMVMIILASDVHSFNSANMYRLPTVSYAPPAYTVPDLKQLAVQRRQTHKQTTAILQLDCDWLWGISQILQSHIFKQFLGSLPQMAHFLHFVLIHHNLILNFHFALLGSCLFFDQKNLLKCSTPFSKVIWTVYIGRHTDTSIKTSGKCVLQTRFRMINIYINSCHMCQIYI